MTREESIDYIRKWLKDEYALNSTDRKVLNMAIKALEQEPCDDATLRDIFCMGCEYKEPCEDWCDVPSYEMTLDQARQAVKDLRKELAPYLMQEYYGDCVSRKAAEEITWEEPSYADALNVLAEVREKIRRLPSVTPQPKTGKWEFRKTIFDIYGFTVECSSCHKKWKTYDEIRWKEENKYCPNCGAKMVEPQESEDKE